MVTGLYWLCRSPGHHAQNVTEPSVPGPEPYTEKGLLSQVLSSAASGQKAASLIWGETSGNTKSQISKPKQITILKSQNSKPSANRQHLGFGPLVFGICLLFGACYLEFVCHLSFVFCDFSMSQYIKHLGLQETEAA